MSGTIRVYTLWAAMRGEDPSPLMIAAEDEFSWEGDPERCDAVFKTARDLAARNDWDVREVVLLVEYGRLDKAFRPLEIPAVGVEGDTDAA